MVYPALTDLLDYKVKKETQAYPDCSEFTVKKARKECKENQDWMDPQAYLVILDLKVSLELMVFLDLKVTLD